MPFFLTEEERRELREVARLFFIGGHPESDPEIKHFWFKWRVYFEVFSICVDSRYGNILHLPYSGGVMEQPHRELQILQYLQSLYREYLNEETKKIQSKIKRR